MSQNKLTQEQKDKIEEFFKKEIGQEDFAKKMRKLLYIAVMQNLQHDDDNLYREQIADVYFWLTLFLETIDPTGILD